MKIHMDYLENKIELFQAQMQQWDKEKSKLQRSAEMAQEKLQLIKENKDREIKDLNRKLSELASKLKAQVQKTGELQDKINQERDSFKQKVRLMNNSVDMNNKSEAPTQIHSGKSMQKNHKYLASINSGSKTATAEYNSTGGVAPPH